MFNFQFMLSHGRPLEVTVSLRDYRFLGLSSPGMYALLLYPYWCLPFALYMVAAFLFHNLHKFNQWRIVTLEKPIETVSVALRTIVRAVHNFLVGTIFETNIRNTPRISPTFLFLLGSNPLQWQHISRIDVLLNKTLWERRIMCA